MSRDAAAVSAWALLDAETDEGAPSVPILDGQASDAEPLGALASNLPAPGTANPFVRPSTAPASYTPPVAPSPEADLAQALVQADADTRRRAAAQCEARATAARRARFVARAAERPGEPAAWTLAPDESCVLLGPVARWLREHGQDVAVPSAARDRAEFVERLNVLVRLADDIATRAQAAADDAVADYAALDARAARCLSFAVDIRQSVWRARLEDERTRLLHASTDIARLAVAQLDAFCASR